MTPSGCPVTPGFPIRRSPDQSLLDSSPRHIAAYHVLHRLSTPRHPPCTLSSLTTLMRDCHTITHRTSLVRPQPEPDSGQATFQHLRFFPEIASRIALNKGKTANRPPETCGSSTYVLIRRIAITNPPKGESEASDGPASASSLAKEHNLHTPGYRGNPAAKANLVP